MIYFDIYSLANPRLIMFCRKGKNMREEVTEAASMICLKSPKQTS